MSNALLTLKKATLGFGRETLFEDVELVIKRNERLTLVGRNGVGKSTFLKMLTGLIELDQGELIKAPKCKIAYLTQESLPGNANSVFDYVAAAMIGHSQIQDHIIRRQLATFGLDPDARPGELSGGELRRAALTAILATDADLLLLDEPTNHLDIETVQWLEDWLETYSGAVVTISHDRTFLENTGTATLWLNDRHLTRINKSFEAFCVWMAEQALARNARREAVDQHIKREVRWLNRGISARRKRNQRRLKEIIELRQRRAALIKGTGQVKLSLLNSPRASSLVIRARKISKSYGDKTLFRDFSTIIRAKDRIGILGANGTGKTTLLKILTGELAPDHGSVKLGANLKTLVIDQNREALAPNMTLRNFLTDGDNDQLLVQGRAIHVIGYMKDFLFQAGQVDMPVGSLSGGERSRLLLAKSFAKEANLLILDEPTNDLDMDTLDLLEDILASYEGTVLLVSHDRKFLDRVVYSTIVLEGDGTAIEYAGGYQDYLIQRKQTQPTETRPRGVSRSEPEKPAVPVEKRRLRFKHKHALESLPGEIETLTMEITTLEHELSDPKLYLNDQERYVTLSDALAQKKTLRSGKEDELLNVEILRDEIADETNS